MFDNDCDIQNTIRPTSSSLTRGPSWSFGLGAKEFGDSAQRISAGSVNEDSQNRFLANQPKLFLQIPTVYLTKPARSKSSFHVYELRIKLLKTNQEWSVYRRYSQFHALHQQLKAKDPAIGKLLFPPKKRLNSKASTIVQDRRRKLEDYIKSVNFYMEHLPADGEEADLLAGSNSLNEQQLRSMLSIETANSVNVNETSRETSQSDCVSTGLASVAIGDESARVVRARSVGSEELLAVDSASEQPDKNIQSDGIDDFLADKKGLEKFNIRMLFNIFISLKEKKDDEFSPEQIDGNLEAEEGASPADNERV